MELFSEIEINELAQQIVCRSEDARTLLPDLSKTSVINFTGLTIEKPVSFVNFIFPYETKFEETHFQSNAYFKGCVFLHDISFSKAHFSEQSDFSFSIFSSAATFNKARFGSAAYFFEVNFYSFARFQGSEFNNLYFYKLSFCDDVNFCGAKFFGKVTFPITEFKSSLLLSESSYGDNAPDFRDAKLPETLEFDEVVWPPPPSTRADSIEQIHAYAWLKAEMEKRKGHEDELLFFAKELRARRILEKPFSPQWLANFTYQIFSSYGRSILLPLAWLFALFALGTAIFAKWPVYQGETLPYDEAAGLSATNLISLLPFKPDRTMTDHLSPAAKIVGDVQAVLGVVLLFLFGLGLRNRFRMK